MSRGSELQRAAAAYKEGDYDTALKIFMPLAEKGYGCPIQRGKDVS